MEDYEIRGSAVSLGLLVVSLSAIVLIHCVPPFTDPLFGGPLAVALIVGFTSAVLLATEVALLGRYVAWYLHWRRASVNLMEE